MKKDHRENTVGPWAKAKLKALEDYLEYYNTALLNQPFKRIYVDAFAGAPKARIRASAQSPEDSLLTGLLEDQEAQVQFISGSPTRALHLANGFHHHYFFDLDASRVEVLDRLTAGRSDVTVDVGDCNPKIRELAPRLSARNIRGVAFLDPYGAHLEWSTIEALARTGTMEVVINFPLGMAINRLITKSGNVPENWNDQLNKCFGTDKWREVSYSKRHDLFGIANITKENDVAGPLLELYLSRLQKIFRFVAKPRLIKNTRGSPLYYLIWAGPNALGLKGADHILGQKQELRRGV